MFHNIDLTTNPKIIIPFFALYLECIADCVLGIFFLRLSMPDDLMGNLNANAEKWTEWKRIAYCLPAYLILSVLSLLSYVYPRCRLVYYISRPFICAHIAAYAYYIHKVGIYGPIVLLLPSVSFMSGGRRKKHFYIFLLHPNRIGWTLFSILFFFPLGSFPPFLAFSIFYFFRELLFEPLRDLLAALDV